MKDNLRTKATVKNVINQLPKVNLKNHGRKNALQNAKETETHPCHLPETKIKFEMKMKNKKIAKVETSENANKSKKDRSKNINNIADSLKSLQCQIKDPKLLIMKIKHIRYLQKKKGKSSLRQ